MNTETKTMVLGAELETFVINLMAEVAQAKQDAADARANFLTMQGSAAELLKRAEKAEADLAKMTEDAEAYKSAMKGYLSEAAALAVERVSLIKTKREQIDALTARATAAEAALAKQIYAAKSEAGE